MKTIAQMEYELISQTMIKFDGNKTKASESLDIPISVLYHKLKEYGLTEYLLKDTNFEWPQLTSLAHQ